jgi:hypothetical protein
MLVVSPHALPPAFAQSGGYSLRFYGNGVDDIDRVKIKIDNPPVPADVGATDFTLEFWMKASAADNMAGSVSCGANVNWIYGNIVFDRDRYNQDRKFGLSIAGGRFVFGVSGNGTGDRTICGTTNVLDNQWHHVAVQRRRSDGRMSLYVDGTLQAQAAGPGGDISYPDNATPGNFCGPSGQASCVKDPYLVIAAEKHDAGSQFPSYSGYLDEVRLSNMLRYSSNFARPSAPFGTDSNTVALYHFDEGPTGPCTGIVLDTSGAVGGPSNGTCSYGGSPNAGPLYTTDTPFGAPGPANTPTKTPTPTRTSTPINTPTTTPTPFFGNTSLSFDGVSNYVSANPVTSVGPLTVEAWVQPGTDNANGLIVIGSDGGNNGWSFELNGGQITFWLFTNQGWQFSRHPTALVAGQWYHVAGTYGSGQARTFVNGVASSAVSVGTLTQGPSLRLGGLSGYSFYDGVLDEVRISNIVRYTANFSVPTAPYTVDANTIGLWSFDEGSGQTVADKSSWQNTGTLGSTRGVDANDPAWVTGYSYP